MPDFYSYGQLNFKRKQISWVLENARAFRDGHWPKRDSTGYFGLPGKNRVKAEGSFVKPALIWAEVSTRLEQCGDDGLDCLAYYLGEATVHVLARKGRTSEDTIERGMNRAIAYTASGRCRRWVNCPEGCQIPCSRLHRRGWAYDEWQRRNHR